MFQWRIQGGGQFLISGNFHPQPLWRPSEKNAPLFGACQSKNKGKYIQCKLNNVLHFVENEYLRDGF